MSDKILIKIMLEFAVVKSIMISYGIRSHLINISFIIAYKGRYKLVFYLAINQNAQDDVLFSGSKCNWALLALKKNVVILRKGCNNLTHYGLYFSLAMDHAHAIFRTYGWSGSSADSSSFFHCDFSTGCQWSCESYYGKGLDEYLLGHTDVASWPSNGQVLNFFFFFSQYLLGHADDEFLSSNGAGFLQICRFIISVERTYVKYLIRLFCKTLFFFLFFYNTIFFSHLKNIV